MGDGDQALDAKQDVKDVSDQANAENNQNVHADVNDLPSSGNKVVIDFYRNSANNDSTKLHDVDISSNSPRPDTSRQLLAEKVNQLRTKESDPKEMSGVERAVKDGAVKSPDLQTDEAKRQLNIKIQDRLAIELEAMLILDGLGDPIMQAADRLRSVAGNDLPDDFDEKLTDWIAYQKRQRIGNEEAERLGLKDDEGNDLRFPCADSDQDLADALNTFADGYEKNQRGELSGVAAEGYGSKEDFNYDWRSSLEMCLDPVAKDDQAQIGSCAMNTQLLAGWTRSPKEMAEAYMGGMTQGYYETASGETVRLNADEIGRGNTNGQEPCVYIGCSLLADAAYGQEHRNGNSLDAMDDALEVLTGYSVSSMDGAYHKLSPGHSMVALNVVHADGSFTKQQYNHWNQLGDNEPGEGLDYDYSHQADLSKLQVG